MGLRVLRRGSCALLGAALFSVLARAAHAQTVRNRLQSRQRRAIVHLPGNRATGVELDTVGFPTTFTTLNVVGLTTDIAPPSGDRGVAFISDGNVAVNVEPARSAS